MTRSRLSMIVAAAGLVLVGLLAAVLFTPGDDAPTDETIADDTVTPVEPTVIQTTNPLGYEIDVPKIEIKPEPVVETKPEKKPEPKVEPAPTPKVEGGVIDYTIQSGDMISKIAVKYGCKVEDIYKLNDGLTRETANRIRVGQVIKVPVGEKGAEAVANVGNTPASADYQPRRVVTAEAGDTAFSLAIEHYGARNMFRKIIDANPELPWQDRLKGGEQVVLPEIGTAASSPKPAADKVERDSLIPPRR